MADNLNSDQKLVSIMCLTFNHEAYLGFALESFLMQKTNFEFEIIVHDDASTDNTKQVIEEYAAKYPNIVKPIYQSKNLFSDKSANIWADHTFPACNYKYIAICEGDDYWTDPLKLQKQVDFLEANPDFSIAWTNYSKIQDGVISETGFKEIFEDVFVIDFDNLFNPYCTLSLTALFRNEKSGLEKLRNFKYCKDNTLYALLLCYGKGAFLNFNSSVYRIHSGGIYSMKSFFYQKYSSYLNIKEICEQIPAAQTKNLKETEDGLLRLSAIEVLKFKSNGEKLTVEQENVLELYLKKSSFKIKRKFFKYFVKVRFLKSKTAQI